MDILDQMLDALEQGGFTMIPLLLFALGLWYGLGFRLLTLRRGTRGGCRELLALHRREPERAAAGLLEAAVKAGAAIERRAPAHLRRHLEVACGDISREAGRCRILIQSLVVVAPLTGLLGTVSGMIETFDSLAELALFTQSGGVAGGIAEALFSTQMGLAVAIPGLILGRLLDRREALLNDELEELAAILTQTGHEGVKP